MSFLAVSVDRQILQGHNIYLKCAKRGCSRFICRATDTDYRVYFQVGLFEIETRKKKKNVSYLCFLDVCIQ